ncbi:MAG: hypothetical protein RIA64_01565 [Rhodospirillales bacterium]
MTHIEHHPLAGMFPMMDDQSFSELADDILENGLREPIVLYEGKILDGRNRFKACDFHLIEPDFVTYEGDDPLGYVISLNLRRRHLTTSQRAMVAARIANLTAGRPTNNSANLRNNDAAQMMNVGTRSVETARKVREHGTPEVVTAVESGEMSVSAAAVLAGQPEDVQATVMAAPEDERKATISGFKAAVKEAALGDVKLPTPKQAVEISKEQGGAAVVGSDGKYHCYMDAETKDRAEKWRKLRLGILGDFDLDISPEEAISCLLPILAEDTVQEARERYNWLGEFIQVWEKKHAA